MLPPCQVKLWHSLSILPFICRGWKLFCVCGLCTETREGWAGCWVWLNNSGYWQSGAGLLTSHIQLMTHNTELSISLSHEDSASFRHEYILPHLVGQSFSIWPWQGHIPNGSHPTPQGLCTNNEESKHLKFGLTQANCINTSNSIYIFKRSLNLKFSISGIMSSGPDQWLWSRLRMAFNQSCDSNPFHGPISYTLTEFEKNQEREIQIFSK